MTTLTEAQRKRFDLWIAKKYGEPLDPIVMGHMIQCYTAACEDAEGLVRALERSANGLRHCARWNISEEKEKAIMTHVIEIENLVKQWRGNDKG